MTATTLESLKKNSTKQLVSKANRLGVKNVESMSREQLINSIFIEDVVVKDNFESKKVELVTPSKISKLRDEVAKANIEHVEVQMPIKLVYDSNDDQASSPFLEIEFSNGVKANAGRIGLQYMAYRFKTGGKIVSKFLDNKVSGQEIVSTFNTAWEAISPKKRGALIAAIVNTEIVGLMRNYTSVQHNEVIDAIESFGLSNSISFSYVDKYCMTMILSVSAFDDFIAGLRITNGHSGHVSFRYSSAFKVNDFEFDIPLVDRVRHLSSVIASFANLKALIEAAGDLRIDEMLRKTSLKEVQRIINAEFIKPSKRQQFLLENPEIGEDCSNALDYVISLSKYTKVNGYKKAAISILTKIVDVISKK